MAREKSIGDAAVLERALLVISDRGPETFTLGEVSQAVGLSPATLLQRFGSKRELLVRAAKQAYIKLESDVQHLKQRNLPWNEELLQLLGGTPEGFGSRQEIANSLAVLKLDIMDEQLHPIARALFVCMRQRVVELLRQGQALGCLSKGMDVSAVAWELDALRHGLVIQWALSGTELLSDWMRKGLLQYLERMRT